MRCIVTAGPTYETMDNVRRLTNFSTGRLGTELANYLSTRGHDVVLLVGEQATYNGERKAARTEVFSTTANLRDRLEALSAEGIEAVFHSAAVSDFTFGKIWSRSPSGDMTEVKSGKISTRTGTLLAELVPTPKVIGQMRGWFPKAKLVGWKYEVDGNRDSVIAAARKQIRESLTDACIANGPAYGLGFGVVKDDGDCAHIRELHALFAALADLIEGQSSTSA